MRGARLDSPALAARRLDRRREERLPVLLLLLLLLLLCAGDCILRDEAGVGRRQETHVTLTRTPRAAPGATRAQDSG